ncbi:MAG TPA: sensor domain-containing protein [Trebonia sp.]|nr:sensor domain-containing protein [Trebonia sp.]
MSAIRDLVSPRTWLAYIHHLAGLFIGLAAGIAVVVFMVLGVAGIPLMLIGIPVLGLTMRGATGFARFERARFGFFLGTRIAAWPAGTRAGYRWGLVPRWGMFVQRATWGELGYALLRLPVSVVTFALSNVVWAVSLVLITLPVYDTALPGGGAQLGGTVVRGTPAAARAAQRPGRPGQRARGKPGAGGRRGRGRTAPDRARPARRRAATAGGPRDGTGPGQVEVRRRRGRG